MRNRLVKVRSDLDREKFDAILISSLSNIIWLTGFLSFSNQEREAFVFITKEKQYIITDGRYKEAVLSQIKEFELLEVSHKNTFEQILKNLIKKLKIKKIGIEEDNLTVSEYKKIRKQCNDVHHYTVKTLRIIKDKSEINLVKKACKLTDKTFDYVLGKIKKGITEKELAFEIEFFIKKNGAKLAFNPIVAFGKNSSIPHHKPTGQRLKTNDCILLDLGAKTDNYCGDMTRVVFFGKATDKQKKVYNTALESQKKSIEFLTSHFSSLTSEPKELKTSAVNQVARKYIIEQGYPPIPHSLGHGIGIEAHELPRLSPKSKEILKPGMVFSIEPGIYLKGAFGVRIEDLILLNEDNIEILTRSPKKPIEI